MKWIFFFISNGDDLFLVLMDMADYVSLQILICIERKRVVLLNYKRFYYLFTSLTISLGLFVSSPEVAWISLLKLLFMLQVILIDSYLCINAM